MIDAVVLLGFGGPNNSEEIRPFLDRVLAGRKIPPARYESVVQHYVEIGGKSPYNELTRRQADALQHALVDHQLATAVSVAYRNAAPEIEDVLTRLAEHGAKRVLGIILAPHESVASTEKYKRSVELARLNIGLAAPIVDFTQPYYEHPLFIRAQADRVRDAWLRMAEPQRLTKYIFTAHSIPRGIEDSGRYERQVTLSAGLIARELGVHQWCVAYQSRSGAPSEPWLEPDVRDVLRSLPAEGISQAVVAPIGFLCDHVEVLYDLDVDAAGVARESGVEMVRARALNDHPLFIRLLAECVLSYSAEE